LIENSTQMNVKVMHNSIFRTRAVQAILCLLVAVVFCMASAKGDTITTYDAVPNPLPNYGDIISGTVATSSLGGSSGPFNVATDPTVALSNVSGQITAASITFNVTGASWKEGGDSGVYLGIGPGGIVINTGGDPVFTVYGPDASNSSLTDAVVYTDDAAEVTVMAGATITKGVASGGTETTYEYTYPLGAGRDIPVWTIFTESSSINPQNVPEPTGLVALFGLGCIGGLGMVGQFWCRRG
jgi:hypothetical protein